MTLRGVSLKKSYGARTVLRDISLTIASGEIVGLLGPNGAGKTTTFYSIVGAVHPEQGRIFLDAHDISGMAMHQRARLGIGYLPQEPSIFRKLTVEDNLRIILQTLNLSAQEQKQKEEELLTELGLTARIGQVAGTLSGGEKRRLEICRALLNDPKFLLLDEPFVGIDPITIADLQGILSVLKSKGLGILITDHNVRDTLKIIDRAYIIYEGKVLLEGSADYLITHEEARRIYLGQEFQI